MIDNHCPICGAPISERPRGSRHGSPPKSCSEPCRAERKRRIERDRYALVRGTPHWKEVRADYLAKLRARLEADPEFALVFRAESAARVREWKERLHATDPARHEQMKAQKRAERAAWRERLLADPTAWDAHKSACRAWYAALSPADKERIYNVPRRKLK